MPVVADVSAVVEFIRGTPLGGRVHDSIREQDVNLPHLCAVEAASALRGLVRGGELSSDRAERALTDLADFAAERHPVEPFLQRIWQLRHNLTAYDATYVALAEALDATLITVDDKLDTPAVTRLVDVEVVR